MLCTSILFGEENKLGQHNMIHAKVALEFVQSVEERAVSHIRVGQQQLVNDLKLFLSRSTIRPCCETRAERS